MGNHEPASAELCNRGPAGCPIVVGPSTALQASWNLSEALGHGLSGRAAPDASGALPCGLCQARAGTFAGRAGTASGSSAISASSTSKRATMPSTVSASNRAALNSRAPQSLLRLPSRRASGRRWHPQKAAPDPGESRRARVGRTAAGARSAERTASGRRGCGVRSGRAAGPPPPNRRGRPDARSHSRRRGERSSGPRGKLAPSRQRSRSARVFTKKPMSASVSTGYRLARTVPITTSSGLPSCERRIAYAARRVTKSVVSDSRLRPRSRVVSPRSRWRGTLPAWNSTPA